MNFRLLIVALVISLSSLSITAQMTGISIEVDTAFYGVDTPNPEDTFDVTGELDGYVTYQVFADFTNPTDLLSAIYSDVVALGTIPMEIDAPCGCFNPVETSLAMDGSNNSFFWGAIPMWEFDSYWTIGMESGDSPGVLPQTIGLPNGTEICSELITDGSVYTTGGPINAIAGDDLRVLVAQVTTCDDWFFSANFQIFIGGDQSQIQFFESLAPTLVEDPCDLYVTNEAEVTGSVFPCFGGDSPVSIAFLGAGDPSLATYSLFDQSGDLVGLPQNSSTFENLSPGNYSMVLIDEFYCIDTTDFAVTAPGQIVADFQLSTDNDCFGEGDATVCLLEAPTGGSGALTISVEDPNGNSVASVDGEEDCWTNLVCQDGDGSFSFSIQDDEGCFLNTVLTVNCPQPIDAEISIGEIDCQGNANGTIGADASGGSGNLYLTVNTDTLLLPSTSSNLAPGIYNVQIIDDLGCSPSVEIVEILDPEAIDVQILSAAPISCGSDCNGAVDILFFGGTGDLNFEISDVFTGIISESLDSLCASEYIVLVSDSNDCASQAPFTIDAPPPLEFLISSSPATCTGMSDGSADIFPAGGTGELTWTVLDTLGNVANLNNLSEMTYTATVADVLGCEITDTFSIGVGIITDMILTTFPSPVTCWNAEDGTITVSVDGGDFPFTYLWSDPFNQTSSTAVGLTEDVYSVTVTDNIGCNITTVESITHIEGCLFIADAVTPNDDGYNDEWIVGGLLDFPLSVVKVYNRYGQLLFHSTEGDISWNGRFNNQRLPVADYYYTIELTPYDPPITGTVSLKY